MLLASYLIDFFFHLSNNAELIITSTEPALWTRAPTIGLSTPVIASMIAAKFSIIEKLKLILMVVIIFFESSNKWGS